MAALEDIRDFATSVSLTPTEAAKHGLALNRDGQRRTAFELLSFPNIGISDLARIWPQFEMFHVKHREQLEIDAKYDVYLARQAADIAAFRRDEALELPDEIDYGVVKGLSNEARAKLAAIRPRTIGQAGRIDGLTPAALTLLVGHIRRGRKPKSSSHGKWMSPAPAKPDLTADRAAALRLTPVSRETLARLDQFVELLLTWTNTTNLVSSPDRSPTSGRGTSPIRSSSSILRRRARTWIDLGSGAGFPGLVDRLRARRSTRRQSPSGREQRQEGGLPAGGDPTHRRAGGGACRADRAFRGKLSGAGRRRHRPGAGAAKISFGSKP